MPDPAPRVSGPHLPGRPEPSPLLVCVGDLMVDVAVEAPALARGGDVAGAVRVGPGGSAANVAAWAVADGARARLAAGRGDDLGGRLLAAALAERGIGLAPDGPAPSASGAMLVVMEAGERTFVADPGANLHLAEEDVTAAMDGADAVFVSGYPLLRPATVAAALAAAAVARLYVVTDDPAARAAMATAGARVLPDEPDAGLNPALAHGAAVAMRRFPRDGVALLSADLPALRPA
ncbi:MAG TPA: PfkB family carbohydrate kinase, partial [Actinomycetes bacterium]|nr:PfkB family carbohydrate kinase [Actinomycetes bacterium]